MAGTPDDGPEPFPDSFPDRAAGGPATERPGERPAGDAPGALPSLMADVAAQLFAERLGIARRYAERLATDGLTRGLLGPREAGRIWDRHLVNSAALADLVADGARVVDVGSGAGLPGIPLALARPDIHVVLLEPMLRRTTFLTEVVEELGLGDRVQVVRGRAPESVAELPFVPDHVTARAVAPLDRLVSWTMPLMRRSGVLLALRGSSAAEEITETAPAVLRWAGGPAELVSLAVPGGGEPVTVVRVERRNDPPAGSSRPDRRRRGKRAS